MGIDNLWGNSLIDEMHSTEKINKIMKCQCRYLKQITNNIVFANFAEIRMDGSLVSLAKTMIEALNSASIINFKKEIGDLSTSQLIDANSLYNESEYGFELYTDTYKLRLFELQMKPIYPITLTVDEGINSGISSQLSRVCTQAEIINKYTIFDDDMFCSAIKVILQSNKVRYIIKELVEFGNDKKENTSRSASSFQKIIVCEGHTDELVLRSIALKLKRDIAIVCAEGKQNIPKIAANVAKQNKEAKMLLLADSDGDEKATLKILKDSTSFDGEIVVVPDTIENWFYQNKSNFSKIRLLQELPEIISDTDIEQKAKEIPSLRRVIDFINR